MSTKREKILTEANRLFVKKGYFATSVQEIVKQSQISKGSFYNYFKSKEELAIHLFQQKQERLWEKMMALEEKMLDDRECFAAQLKVQLEHIDENGELMQMAFQQASSDRELHQLLAKNHLRHIQWLSQRLVRIYGENIKPYVIDCASILVGLIFMHSLRLFVNSSTAVDLDAFGPYLLRRMDGIVASFGEEEEPLLTQQMIDELLQHEEQERLRRMKQARRLIGSLRTKLQEIKLEKKRFEQIFSCLDTLEEELSDPEDGPREYIVEGLMLYLRNQKLPTIDPELTQLNRLMHDKL